MIDMSPFSSGARHMWSLSTRVFSPSRGNGTVRRALETTSLDVLLGVSALMAACASTSWNLHGATLAEASVKQAEKHRQASITVYATRTPTRVDLGYSGKYCVDPNLRQELGHV